MMTQEVKLSRSAEDEKRPGSDHRRCQYKKVSLTKKFCSLMLHCSSSLCIMKYYLATDNGEYHAQIICM